MDDRDEVRARVIELVRLIRSGEGSEEQEDDWVDELKGAVRHPNVTDLIFYPDTDQPMTDEQIADRALAYRPDAEEPYDSKWFFS